MGAAGAPAGAAAGARVDAGVDAGTKCAGASLPGLAETDTDMGGDEAGGSGAGTGAVDEEDEEDEDEDEDEALGIARRCDCVASPNLDRICFRPLPPVSPAFISMTS